MTPSRHLWACATHMMARHGPDAEIHAAFRADDLLEKGDLEGERVWLAIVRCIEAARGMRGARSSS